MYGKAADNQPHLYEMLQFLPEALASFDNPEKESFLKIEGKKSFKSWRRRWCILKDNFISCFKAKGVKNKLFDILPGCVNDNDIIFRTPNRMM